MTTSNFIVAHVVLCPNNVQTKRIMIRIPKNFNYRDFVVHIFNLEPDMFKDKAYIDTTICYGGKMSAPYTPNLLVNLVLLIHLLSLSTYFIKNIIL